MKYMEVDETAVCVLIALLWYTERLSTMPFRTAGFGGPIDEAQL
jgi:hypothetical protein